MDRIAKPKYREGHPRLHLGLAKKECEAERELCLFENERGRRVGDAFISRVTDDELVLEFAFHAEYISFVKGSASLPIEAAPNASDKLRVIFRCPDCKARVMVLAFDGHWACCRCLKLGFRSQQVPHSVRLYEKLLALKAEVAKGRKKFQRHGTFNEMERKLAALRKQVGKQPRRASVAHTHLINARWIAPSDFKGELFHPDFLVVDGEIKAAWRWVDEGTPEGPPPAPHVTAS